MRRMAPSDRVLSRDQDRPRQLESDAWSERIQPWHDRVRRPPIAVGPGRPPSHEQVAIGASRDAVTGYPIQYAKVQPPPLRDETLARDRLLDWLHAKIHSKVILILADAGYGKTTLLADFARRTRLRTIWYRLDDDDRDWTSIIHHLVAAGREHDPMFAPATFSMLSETSLSGPSREAVLDLFIRELPTIAPTGAVLIFDDFHLVDEAPDMRYIVRELINRSPERLSIVFCEPSEPSRFHLPDFGQTGKWPNSGTDDLRFDFGRDGATLQRNLRARRWIQRSWPMSQQDRRLGSFSAAGPGGAARSIAGRNPAVRSRSFGCRSGALRLPRGGGRWRPTGRASAVPYADVHPSGCRPRLGIAVVTGLTSTDVARLTASAERMTLLEPPSRWPEDPAAIPPAGSRISRGPARAGARR